MMDLIAHSLLFMFLLFYIIAVVAGGLFDNKPTSMILIVNGFLIAAVVAEIFA